MTAVEYALVLGLVVVGIMAALSGFDDHASDELADRGNRVGNPEALRSTETVPVGPVATTTTTMVPVTTTVYVPPTTTTTTTIVLPTTTTTTTTVPGPGPTSTTTPVPTTTTTIQSSTPHAFVGSLSGSSVRNGSKWTATVLVTIVDQHGAPLAGVYVSGAWSESTAHVADCTTGAAGSCTVSQTDLRRTGGSAVPSSTYYVLGLAGDDIVAAGPDADDFIEVFKP